MDASDRKSGEAAGGNSLPRFLLIVAQLGLLLAVFKVYNLEEPKFLGLAALVVGAFCVHYWLPRRLKEPFWILASVAGSFLLLDVVVATLLLLCGGLIYSIVACPLSARMRTILVLAVVAGVALLRPVLSGAIPAEFWLVFGAIFAFRVMLFLYELQGMRNAPGWREFFSYFFLLPNYYFLLFPIIDYQALRSGYLQRETHALCAQGVRWMARGTIHLLLYRLVVHFNPVATPDNITDPGTLLFSMIMVYLFYLRVSGHFHLIIGMLNLFGYDLPETHHRYLLASSPLDYWRRINIYWKDMMVKLVFYPLFFRFRSKGSQRAQLIATACVFGATWAMHSYQWYWLRGSFLLSLPDGMFWIILGLLVLANLWWSFRRPPRPNAPVSPLLLGLRIAATFLGTVFVWYLWNSPSLEHWLDLVTWWRIGR